MLKESFSNVMFQKLVPVETIVARIRQASIHDAMIYANAVAAIQVSHQGSQSLPSHQGVMEFLRSRGHTLNLR